MNGANAPGISAQARALELTLVTNYRESVAPKISRSVTELNRSLEL